MSLMPESTLGNMKQHYLAKSWLESILQHELPSEDLYTSLKDGIYLYEIIHLIQNIQQTIFHELPEDRIKEFLKCAKAFGLQSSDLFSVNDLLNRENMNNVRFFFFVTCAL
ncbi:hypothetical protein BD770DRAFT_56666 [Pilaira anomala]|nr:hypothetical protein BD770DRAFT_56666 [Pilaira anomala]